MKKKIFWVAAAFIGSQLHAQDSTRHVLDEVILTANKYPQKQSETGKVVTVIGRDQLERSGGKSLGEILNSVAGTTIIGANNSPGTNNTPSIRGAAAGNTLILVDGIPVTDPSVNNNYFDLNFFAVDQVERIEILKGGQSTLYGSDAVAGVINIITRKAQNAGTHFQAGLSGGTYSTFRQNAGLYGRTQKMDYSGSYTHLSSKGFSAAYDRNGTGNFDKDGIDQHNAMARLGYQLTPRLKAEIFGNYSFYKADLDASAYADEKDHTVKNDNLQAGTGFTYRHSTGVLRFNYQFNYVEREYLDDSISKGSPYLDWSISRFIGRTHYGEVFGNWKWNTLEFLAGADIRYNNTDQFYLAQFPPFSIGGMPTLYETSMRDKSMTQASPYASVLYRDGKFTGELGGRLNVHSAYGSNFTFTLNPAYQLDPTLKIFGNLYTAFKAPTLYQLFDPLSGNKDLKPEKGLVAEAGATWSKGKKAQVRVVGFYRRTHDAIQYILVDPVFFTSQYKNVSRQYNYGFEMEASYSLGKWNALANYTYTDGKTTSPYDGTGGPLGKDTSYYNLYRIPKHAVNVQLGYSVTPALYISASLHTVSKRSEFIYGAPPETLKGYTTVDLYASYTIGRKWKLFADLRNLTDKQYFDIAGYNCKRFNATGGIQVNF